MTPKNTTMKGQVMTKNEEYFAAVRLLMETTPNLTAKAAITLVAKRKRINFEAVNTGYYRQKKTADILAKLEPIKIKPAVTDTVTDAKSAMNGNPRFAAINALLEYETYLEAREAAVEQREQQMDELRAKIATLV